MTNATDKEQISGEAPCPHCGDEAYWRYLDESKQVIEITCTDCGAFEVTRAGFDAAEFDIVEPEL